MNSENQSQDFEKLQHLLKLKRYEQPPPRYFNDFSARVISHIRADTSTARFETADNLISRTPWLRRLWRKLENQPALSGVLATAVCGLMVAGVFLMEETQPQSITLNPPGEQSGGNNLPAAPTMLGSSLAALPFHGGTNTATIPTGPNLFNQLPSLQTVPVTHKPLLGP